jgi:hypothetical protein
MSELGLLRTTGSIVLEGLECPRYRDDSGAVIFHILFFARPSACGGRSQYVMPEFPRQFLVADARAVPTA